MITVAEIKEKALRRYEDYLRSLLDESEFFPLVLPSNKAIDKKGGISNMHQQLIPVIEQSKSTKGFGYTIETETIDTKFGQLDVVRKIAFTTAEDYLKFLGLEKEAAAYRQCCAIALSEFPELKMLFIQLPRTVINNIVKWDELLRVCRYFKSHPRPGLYIRELPIQVHSKFIERNKGIIAKMLEVIIPGHINYDGETFEEKIGLLEKHNIIRIRFLDDQLRVLTGFEETGISENEINQLNIRCRRVFIVENDISALTFPKLSDSIVIFGRGYNLVSLKHVEWLKTPEIYYWSDFDVQGFEMLSQIRGYFRQTRSLLMDIKTLMAFRDDWDDGEISKVNFLPNLTPSEAEVYCYLKENNKRLEQEKIPYTTVLNAIAQFKL